MGDGDERDTRLSGLLCHGARDDYLSNPFDNSLDNLAWGTAEENAQDSIRHGTHPSLRLGEERNCSKLTEKDVIEINSLVHQGAKQSELARRYGVCQRHISDIKLKRTWKHLWYPQGKGKSLGTFSIGTSGRPSFTQNS